MTSRSALLTVAVLAATLAVPVGSALAQSTPPPVGATYSFACNSSIRSNYTETYEVVSVSGDMLRVQVNDGASSNVYEKPVYLLNTTLYERQTLFGRQSEFTKIPSEFRSLAGLGVGTKVKAWATEVRDNPHTRLEWNYSVSVVGQESLFVPDVGDLDVISVAESRWVDLYSANLVSYYSPELKFPVYWTYRDSNVAEVECTLASVSGVEGFVATRSPTPSSVAGTSLSVLDTTGVRRFPHSAAPLIAMVPANEPVQILDQIENDGVYWYEIAMAGDVQGFIPESAVTGGEGGITRSVVETTSQPAAPATTQQAAIPATTATQTQQSTESDDPAARLARLEQLHNSGLISDEEFEMKKREIGGGPAPTGIADRLRDANEKFRNGALSADAFVAKRAEILGIINPGEMAVEDGLVLIDALLSAQLISPTEHRRKRSEMLSAL